MLGGLEGDVPALAVVRGDYTSWKETWGKGVLRVFEAMLPPLLRHVSIRQLEIKFQYRFVWESETEMFDPGTLFRPDCPLVPQRIHGPLESWKYDLELCEHPETHPENRMMSVIRSVMATPKGVIGGFGRWIDVRTEHGIRWGGAGDAAEAAPGTYDPSKVRELTRAMRKANTSMLSSMLREPMLNKTEMEDKP